MKSIKYFFEFVFVISLFCLFKIIGLKNASNLGSILGITIGPLFRSKNLIKENIKIGLGDIDKKKEKEIILNMWSNIGRTFSEYVFLKDFKFNKTSHNHIKINGYKYLEDIKSNNKPVIFYSGHFANFELMAMELDKFGIKTAAIYRPLNNFLINPYMIFLRKKYICKNQIKKGLAGTKEVIEFLKKKHSIALMVDQRLGESDRYPFFNKQAHTTTLPAQLALKFDCKIIPIYLERNKKNFFKMEVLKPIEFQKTNDPESDKKIITIRINQIIEKMILRNPGQWIWTHGRWK